MCQRLHVGSMFCSYLCPCHALHVKWKLLERIFRHFLLGIQQSTSSLFVSAPRVPRRNAPEVPRRSAPEVPRRSAPEVPRRSAGSVLPWIKLKVYSVHVST